MAVPEHIANSMKIGNNNSMDLKTSEILANNEPMLNGIKTPSHVKDSNQSESTPNGKDMLSIVNNKSPTNDDDIEYDDSDSDSSPDRSLSPTPLQIDLSDKNTENCDIEQTETLNKHDSHQNDDKTSENDAGSGVESFDGKIVYNPDGSAYIIEGTDSEISDNESFLDLPQHEGSIIDHRGKTSSQIVSYPQIASAVYINRNPETYNSMYMPVARKSADMPLMHSYKVYDPRSETDEQSTSESKLALTSLAQPAKPILMCFICKLSFANTKSFATHATNEHNIELTTKEKEILSKDNASAIIQALGKDKEPIMSFLQAQKTDSITSNKSDDISENSASDDNICRDNETEESHEFRKPRSSTSSQNEENDNVSTPKSAKNPVSSASMLLPSPSAIKLFQQQAFPFTRIICEDHPQGKQNGVECPKCDMVLGSTRSLGGHMTMMHSRNSCKTLKCPKCNWHYKYQETLEIHMKEKHPDSETHCVYCLSNQSHPRLARGESYQCGYKPYRCEICNYSTTTKGNLSIHMQSDKHINNVQDLQNNGGTPSDHIKMPGHHSQPLTPSPTTPLLSPMEPNSSSTSKPSPMPTPPSLQRQDSLKSKSKPTWRCDVCNYETNVARNLRIHMTSEKHTHNMMVLQQNVKHMQRDMQMQMSQMAMFGQDPTQLMGIPSPITPTGLSAFQYDPAMFMSAMHGLESPMDLSKDSSDVTPRESTSSSLPEVKLMAAEPNKLFQCAVCNIFSTNSIDELNDHMNKDRSSQKDPEHVMTVAGNYICNLCSYKTNLKANFALHCKTDKHVQRLQLVIHIQEGGVNNEWRLKYINLSNPIQVRCSCCDYYTNTVHKLQVHAQTPRHESSAKIFQNLLHQETLLKSDRKYYYCSLCNHSARSKPSLIRHVKSSKHMRCLSLKQLQNREHDTDDEELEDVFKVKEYAEDDIIKFDGDDDLFMEESSNVSPDIKQEEDKIETAGMEDSVHACPYCNFTSDSDIRIRSHIVSQHSAFQKQSCPLCQDEFRDKESMQKHLFAAHNVTAEGMQRILVMVESPDLSTISPSHKIAASSPLLTPESDKEEGMDMDSDDDDDVEHSEVDEQYRCQMCTKTFLSIDSLYAHQNELGHLELKQTPRGPGYLCWKKGCNQYFQTAQSLQVHFREIHAKRPKVPVSERHMYKFRCCQCSFAFKTFDKLHTHSQCHLLPRCNICDQAFSSMRALYNHYETVHFENMSEAEIEQVKQKLSTLSSVYMSVGDGGDEGSMEVDVKEEKDDNSQESTVSSTAEQSEGLYQEHHFMEDFMNSQAMAENNYNDPTRKYKCHRCKVAFTKQNYLSAHNKTLQHRRGDKMSYPMEKYLDPNRPYKCETCKESFTQKNILLVHYNSVSHLHKQKQAQVSLLGQPSQATSPTLASSNPVVMSTSKISTATPVSSSSSSSQVTASSENSRPYKCNICKVAYSQGTNLDIHLRSVYHQTRASRLQDLATSGEVDLTQPLVEHPSTRVSTPTSSHKKVLADMLQQKSLLTSPTGQPLVVSSSADTPKTPHTPTSVTSVQATPGDMQLQATHRCNRCNATFVSQEVLQQHQQLYCFFAAPGVPANRQRFVARSKPHVQKNLLENFGFECVMQFNELNQAAEVGHKNGGKADDDVEKEEDSDIEINTSIPELNKCVCPICNKKFTSIWVLKCHREEIHKDVVPHAMVENYAEDFADDFNRKFLIKEEKEQQEKLAALTATTTTTPVSESEPHSEQATPTTPSFDAATTQLLQMSMLGMLPMFYPPNMQMAALNLQPPLFPIMMPPVSTSGSVPLPSPSGPTIDPKAIAAAQQLQQQAAAAAAGEKRARTRINDDQLKILRAHFDINNSPTEEQIIAMSDQSGLPQKVIKHWFRNTLFKERQRNKDSPYNFNNPPSTETVIDMEEYHKTGKMPAIDEEKPEEMEDAKKSLEKGMIKKPVFPERSKPVCLPVKIEVTDDSSLNEDSNSVSLCYSAPVTPVTPISTTSTGPLMSPTSITMDPLDNPSFYTTSSGGRRANRTRFTDFQIKNLQEYFDQNAYPKDDDLDHLSKLLNLNPRVIVVWFQNARQKARKVYENQPPESGESARFTRTQGLNYQCKKCSTVFQRYYDLIKHQKKVCYQNEDIPLPFNNDDSMSSFSGEMGNHNEVREKDRESEKSTEKKEESNKKSYECDKCQSTFHNFDLWQEHQNIHMMNPGLFPNFAPDSAFALLQSVAQHHATNEKKSPMKRPLSGSEDEDDKDDLSLCGKRLRTTILPEQLDYLYQKYQDDSNPSRKQLEKISNDVSLKKRVVQVWFQNTRARERKGQFRAHIQLIHKRCPFCRALFRNRSAFESHLAMKHPEEMAKGDVNIDSIPDASQDDVSSPTDSSPTSAAMDMNKLMAQYAMQPFLPLMAPIPEMNDPMQEQMKKMYEESLKKYMEELSGKAHPVTSPEKSKSNSKVDKPSTSSSSRPFEVPLDLSKPVQIKTDPDDKVAYGPKTDISEKSMPWMDEMNSSKSFDDSRSDSCSEGDSNLTSSPTSPGGSHRLPSKRYRTQMTNLQIKIMKYIFQDYKTPTMGECEMLGKEIGLQKRVVQVWFQNARAKEKKAKLVYQKTFGSEPESPGLPEECRLCKFTYSHRYTIQDHVFTSKHVTAVRRFVKSQGANDDICTPGDTRRNVQLEQLEAQKGWEQTTLATHPHLAQLHAIGLQAQSKSGDKTSQREEKHESKHDKRDNQVKKESSSAGSGFNPQMMSPFAGMLPGMDPTAMAMMPYMYPGMPGFFPAMGMPFMQPGMFPGAENMFAYDPSTFGTPLTLLQIPQQAIKDVMIKMSQADATVAQYTQDSKSLSELKKIVSEKDYKCAAENTVDVGYVCKKCTMVFPVKEACTTHQKTQCYSGKNTPDSKSVVKLEQIQYKCSACSENFNTLQEYKVHCSLDVHKSRVTKHNGQAPPSSSFDEPPAKRTKVE